MQLTAADRALAAGIAAALPLEVSFCREVDSEREYEISITTRAGSTFVLHGFYESAIDALQTGLDVANDPCARVVARPVGDRS